MVFGKITEDICSHGICANAAFLPSLLLQSCGPLRASCGISTWSVIRIRSTRTRSHFPSTMPG
ncbi:unnamed protein product [Hymenolepis diminuta]|uniref:Uncharacterized protein n=1 Tax=Hymenolepis diminuta TaxID=6216 RepID=A0A564YBM7_HYMDI|nr:unnamed protein product [Hymenolepis diminuta]